MIGARTKSEQISVRLWLQLMKCTRTIEAHVAARLRRDYGQSLARFDVLSQLDRSEEPWSTVGLLADQVMASSGNITALLDRMEADDLIVRRASPTDRRSQQVRMTRVGRELFMKMSCDHAKWIDEALGGVPAKDREQLIPLLVKTRRAFETNERP